MRVNYPSPIDADEDEIVLKENAAHAARMRLAAGFVTPELSVCWDRSQNMLEMNGDR